MTNPSRPSPIPLRLAAVTLLPLLCALWFYFRPAANRTGFLIDGIIMACLCTFLFKYILFACIGHHLRGEMRLKRQTALLFLPLALFAAYICRYFGAF
ncbi:Uncharacterised protein [Kingella potus]|uniref:Uncharacterized protein n=1 Tax=Kingella potus TaxID=265175 RepID=A0A377QZ75_9NEIS|nr:hypothetical protein [Kingella potus]UOP01661.1 hypothetical protein LVJ84_05815 [Kingella potus]STR00040.1 Uncharacterised protein [Kingella potus]